MFVIRNAILFIFLCIYFCVASPVQAMASKTAPTTVQKANVIKATKLLDKPKFSSLTVATLQQNDLVLILKRHKAWYMVEPTSKQNYSGWVNMLAVRFNGKPKRDGELGIGSLYNSATSNTLPTTSTGIRGFDENDLKKSTADLKQLEILASYNISVERAADFAKQGQLQRQALVNKERK